MSQRTVKAVSVMLLFATQLCFALPEDRTQIMQLRAGSADLNQLAHRGIYTKDVQIDQGKTHIRASEAITEGNEKNQLMKAILKGNKNEQAHYWTLASTNKPEMHAYADVIQYYPSRHLIELIGNARVVQGKDSFSAPKISYDVLHHHVISHSLGEKQTTIIIHPGTLHE